MGLCACSTLAVCECGCGEEVKPGNLFINGHNTRIREVSEETRKKLSAAFSGEKNYFYGKRFTGPSNYRWRGDKVGYHGRHFRMKKIIPKPGLCQICKRAPPKELSNISGEYKLDVSDWQWVCIRCHKIFDDIPTRNLIYRPPKGCKMSKESSKRKSESMRRRKKNVTTS